MKKQRVGIFRLNDYGKESQQITFGEGEEEDNVENGGVQAGLITLESLFRNIRGVHRVQHS